MNIDNHNFQYIYHDFGITRFDKMKDDAACDHGEVALHHIIIANHIAFTCRDEFTRINYGKSLSDYIIIHSSPADGKI